MLTALIKEMRPTQWVKNLLLFAVLVFDKQLTNWDALIKTSIGVVLFSLLASVVYIINDLNDVEADRLHPKKKFRPIAAGDLPIPVARAAIVVILLIVLPLQYWLSPAFLALSLLYLVLNISYSIWLKHIVLLDVLLLASFYLLRVALGVVLIEVERFSPWLYVSVLFLALFMGIGKRRAELVNATKSGTSIRRVLENYTLAYLDQLIVIVLSLSIFTYALYTFSAPNLPENHAMMLTIPFVIYGIFRYMYLVQVKGHGEAPEEILFSDRPLLISVILWGLSVLFIFYYF